MVEFGAGEAPSEAADAAVVVAAGDEDIAVLEKCGFRQASRSIHVSSGRK